MASSLTVDPPPLAAGELRRFLRLAIRFALVGAVLYLAVYAAAERLVYRYAVRNRFFIVRTAPAASQYDFVILGASHAGVFDYRDMNHQLEQMSGAKIVNLSIVGGGIVPNRLTFDYFLTRHRTSHLLYVVDSFAFYSPQWNEERLEDRRLFVRAPFDPALSRLLFAIPGARGVALDYTLGFSKINNPDRFAPDVPADEGARFDRRYRPVPQLDEERLEYLYPKTIDPDTFARYLGQFETLISDARARGIGVILIKPPIPARIYRQLPSEAEFDSALGGVLTRQGIAVHDFSAVDNGEALFQDTDHLNRDGVLAFFGDTMAPLLRAELQRR
jgi:hypothetical protein